MGDRALVMIESREHGDVGIYTHWTGGELPMRVRHALLHGWDRWIDPPYLARIVYDQIVPEAHHGKTTGYGICGANAPLVMRDLNYPVLYVCTDDKTVRYGDAGPRIAFLAFVNKSTVYARWPVPTEGRV